MSDSKNQTPREPDRFDAQAREILRRDGPLAEIIAAALRAAESSALERAAQICRSMADTINATPRVSQFEALLTAAIRIERLIPPAAAPAADQWVWGTCVDCPRDPGEYHHPHPEYCQYRDRYDHKIPWKGRAPAAEPEKAQGAEAPDPERDRNRHNAMLVEAWREEFGRLCDALYPGHNGLLGWKHIHFKIAELLAARAAPPKGEGK